jgi:hypothetical protein
MERTLDSMRTQLDGTLARELTGSKKVSVCVLVLRDSLRRWLLVPNTDGGAKACKSIQGSKGLFSPKERAHGRPRSRDDINRRKASHFEV